ncbi:M14 family metallopeptidase [uncultured Clostridium sp.]|uniref:M14 family metallopeptidase n=1 Tax=uncultured Clostridium sp. TaxID=59620 RepID=UPI0025FC051F|nr:M14 family metallopeptidase [uncultured Clostridium sp.]
MKEILSIGQLKAGEGEKVQGLVKILDTEIKLPITLINGQKEGKTVIITAGIHGCEYPGIKTAIELANEIDPDKVSGNIIIVHIVNTLGFKGRNAYIMPEDNKNMLRVFPGDKNGTTSEKIAYFITKELYSKADFNFDLHGGDLHEELLPHIYYPEKADKEVVEKCIDIAESLGVNYYLKSNNVNGTFTSAAVNNKVPGLLIERGGCGLCMEDEVKAYKKDIKNALSILNVLDSPVEVAEVSAQEMKEAIYLSSEKEGLWTTFVRVGDNIKKGDKLAEIRDCFNNIIETYYAEFDGIVLVNTMALSVRVGDDLITYGRA